MNKNYFSFGLLTALTVSLSCFAWGGKKDVNTENFGKQAGAAMEAAASVADSSALPALMNEITEKMNGMEGMIENGGRQAVARNVAGLSQVVRSFSSSLTSMVPEDKQVMLNNLVGDYNKNLKNINRFMQQGNDQRAKMAFGAMVDNWSQIEALYTDTAAVPVEEESSGSWWPW